MRRTVLVGVLALVLAGCTDTSMVATPPGPAPSPTAPTPTAPTPTAPTPTAPPPAAAAGSSALPVYYVTGTAAGPRLAREFHRVTTTDPVSEAVREMFRPAADPDYRTPWPPGSGLHVPVTTGGGVITVDLTDPAGGAPPDASVAGLALQQLVFTVQAAAQSTDPVRLLVGGAPARRVLGVPVTGPLEHGDRYALRSLVQIDTPADGAAVGRDVVVAGEAAVFEASVPWEVRRDGVVVRSGAASTSQGQVFSPFRFTVTLEPGRYEVRVSEDDPSGGEGRPPTTDTKTIAVG